MIYVICYVIITPTQKCSQRIYSCLDCLFWVCSPMPLHTARLHQPTVLVVWSSTGSTCLRGNGRCSPYDSLKDELLLYIIDSLWYIERSPLIRQGVHYENYHQSSLSFTNILRLFRNIIHTIIFHSRCWVYLKQYVHSRLLTSSHLIPYFHCDSLYHQLYNEIHVVRIGL